MCIQTFVQKHPIFFDNPFKPEDNYRYGKVLISREQKLIYSTSSSPSDLAPFKKFMGVVTEELKQQAVVISETFPANMDVYYVFVDRVLEDVVCS